MSRLAPYRSLGEREIRLIDFSAQRGHPSLVHASLDDPLEYRALSYCWGTENCLHSFHLGTDHLIVTSALFEILSALRKNGFKGRIWADMVCIDQSSNSEKSQQIPLMTEIFSKAKAVYAWLSTSPPEDLTIAVLENVHDNWQSFRAKMERLDGPKPLDHVWSNMESVVWLSDIVEAMRASYMPALGLFGSPWWLRTWCYQEALVASTLEFVVGKLFVPEKLYLSSLMFLVHFKMYAGLIRGMPWARLRIFDSKIHLFSERLRRKNAPQRQDHTLGSVDHAMKFFHFQQLRECSYKQDRIYGIVGVLEPALRKEFLIDTSDVLQAVYTKAACAMIGRSLDLLSVGSRSYERLKGLSSWVPDFSWDEWHVPMASVRPFSAAKSRKQTSIRLLDRDGRLQPRIALQGFVLDAVDKVVPFQLSHEHRTSAFMRLSNDEQASIYEREKPLEMWISEVLDVVTTRLRPEKGLKKADLQAIFDTISQKLGSTEAELRLPWWKLSLQAYYLFTMLRHQPRSLRQYQKLFTELPKGALAWAVIGHLVGRCFFTTTNGRIGLGPITARSGDLVCIINEAKTPLMFRGHRSGRSFGGAFVGEAYVHGVMHGEALRFRRRKDDVDFILE